MRSSFKFLRLLTPPYSLFRINKFLFARNLKPKQIDSDAFTKDPQNKIKEPQMPKTDISQQMKEAKLKKTDTKPKLLREHDPVPLKETFGKSKEKKTEQKTKSGIFSQTIQKSNMEAILNDFKATKTNFDISSYLTFLSDIIKTKKTQAYLTQADVDLKRNIYQEILQIPEVKECILALKSHIIEMDNHQITNYLSLLSKIDYYDEEIISFLSTRIIKKEVKLSSIAISYLIWSLAKYRLRNEMLLEVLVESLLAQKSVGFFFYLHMKTFLFIHLEIIPQKPG